MAHSASIASLFNLVGPELIIITLLILGFVAALIFVDCLFSRPSRGRDETGPPSPPPLSPTPSVGERLRHLDGLRQQNLVSEAEYEEQRRRIISDF
jgi:hypothetical protein